MTGYIHYKAVSDIGCVRTNNEDMAFVVDKFVRDSFSEGEITPRGSVGFAVADGMGGYTGGEVASEIVCRSFASFIRSVRTDDESLTINLIKTWAKDANDLVNDTAALRPELSEMGTTFIALIFIHDKCYLLNIGDSRCYRFRSGILKQLSTDHSERQRRHNPDIPSNIIYNFLGIPSGVFFSDVTELTPISGDIYILCSDGLTDLLDDETIEAHADNIEELVTLAKEAGGKDNITIIRLEVSDSKISQATE